MALGERRLVRRLRARDERAFRELVHAHSDLVVGVTLRMLNNRAEAEEMAQEVFVTAFKSIDQFRGDSKLSTWLYRVATNHCKNRLKYLARRHVKSMAEFDERRETREDDGGPRVAPSASPRPDRLLEGAELQLVLQAAIAELDEDQRILVILRDVEELSYDEICQITDLPE